MENILIAPRNEKQSNLLKSLFNEMNVRFYAEDNKTVSPELEKIIKETHKFYKKGELKVIDPRNL
jgi:hypothetical protein